MYKLKISNNNYEITVEQICDDFPGKYITTFWNKENEHQVDRQVMERETCAGALEQAFVWLGNIQNKWEIKFG